MDPILEWFKTLWHLWDVRILVLLSLTLQIILSIFGNRRKYISSLWISVLVRLCYSSADWVATAALGKLPDAEHVGNPTRAIWASLLLLHLGGPDAITAYSLVDNQLWRRHLLVLVVKFSFAGYVVLSSWKNSSGFLVLSSLALAAGIIKYGQKIWVLKAASDDKSATIVPIGDVGNYGAINIAPKFLKEFKKYVLFGDRCYKEVYFGAHLRSQQDISISLGNPGIDIYYSFWYALEIEMGLMFDLLYTKVPMTYSKAGFIYRCIHFACVIIMVVGLIFLLIFAREKEKWHAIDVAVTVILLAGALVSEVYAIVMLYLSSDWTMLWLIKHRRSTWVIKLRRTFPWFFSNKTRWSKKMGQFDLLGICLKGMDSNQKPTVRILGSLFGDNFNMHPCMYRTHVNVDRSLYTEIVDFCLRLSRRDVDDEDEIWKSSGFADMHLQEQILLAHIVTETCYHLDVEWEYTDHTAAAIEPSQSGETDREMCKTMSHYMMYLLVSRHSLLPAHETDDLWRMVCQELSTSILKGFEGDRVGACQVLLNSARQGYIFGEVAEYLKGKHKTERWQILKSMWLRLLCYAASKGQKNEHLQQLRHGGELLTLLWFFLLQCHNLQVGDQVLDSLKMGIKLNRMRLSRELQLQLESESERNTEMVLERVDCQN